MNRRSATLALLTLGLLAAGIWGAHRFAFDWHSLRVELRSVSYIPVALGIACIYAGLWLRAVRWKVLMSGGNSGRVSANSLVAPQFIGFTAVALFGRLADLTRPYLIARRTGLPVAGQIAVYSVERIFDLAAAAILFSVTLAFAPRNLPHHEAFVRAGIVSLTATLALAAIALTVRFAGDSLAQMTARFLRPLAPALGESVAARILDFRAGLDTLRSLRDLITTLGLSLLIWLGIAESYVQAAHALAATPQLAGLTFTQSMLIMATSMGGSMVQLPVLGWFTQIALLAAALHTFFDAPLEAATACGAVILVIITLSIIPAGLFGAQRSGLSLREAARSSATAEDEGVV